MHNPDSIEDSTRNLTTTPTEEDFPDSNNGTSNGTSTDEDTGQVNLAKTHQIARIYALIDTLMNDGPDANEGFSYAYKYKVPQVTGKEGDVEVSVQQSLHRHQQDERDSIHNTVKKTPQDYQSVQDKIDEVLGNSANYGMPVHLNTPGVYGPLLLSRYNKKQQEEVVDEGVKVDEVVPEDSNLEPTKLVLRPVAKAVAGARGVAVASPMARAVLRRGQPVSLEYEPDAVAIAGPGGRAHAHPEFSVDYIESQETGSN